MMLCCRSVGHKIGPATSARQADFSAETLRCVDRTFPVFSALVNACTATKVRRCRQDGPTQLPPGWTHSAPGLTHTLGMDPLFAGVDPHALGWTHSGGGSGQLRIDEVDE